MNTEKIEKLMEGTEDMEDEMKKKISKKIEKLIKEMELKREVLCKKHKEEMKEKMKWERKMKLLLSLCYFSYMVAKCYSKMEILCNTIFIKFVLDNVVF